jgi:hypothetical protein
VVASPRVETWGEVSLTQSFKMSPDPQLVDKIRDVVGL